MKKKWTVKKLQGMEAQWQLGCLRRQIQEKQGNLVTPQQIEMIIRLESQLGDL